ncbi:hypothetical protein [Lacticaseibacillus daqingensis]|uniref:hypothetical protein n=1 Tax=Lacticaseibacillus daqingensis TaxID=2486014 RepID=UPI000F7AA4C5|nr:hypothetical protein [Lacticaseibacillus daqingensis]
MNDKFEQFDLIQEITENDGHRYAELGNIMMNGRAERAALNGLIKQVRILQLNIPHSTAVRTYETYINETYQFPPVDVKQWDVWEKPAGPVRSAYEQILRENHIS